MLTLWAVLVQAATGHWGAHFEGATTAVKLAAETAGLWELAQDAERLLSASQLDRRVVAKRLLQEEGSVDGPQMALPAWAVDEPELPLPAWAGDESDVPQSTTEESRAGKPIEDAAVDSTEGIAGEMARAVALVGAGEFQESLDTLFQALQRAPRDAMVWTLVLQVCAALVPEAPATMRRGLTSLCDSLRIAGMTSAMLAPWYMQADRLSGAPQAALLRLNETRKLRTISAGEWAVAAVCWQDVGREDFQQQAMAEMRRAPVSP